MSAMIAWALTMSPPAPIPWIARKAMSSAIVWLSPASIEPARKIRIAAMEDGLSPVHVAELPVDRRRDGRREQIRGDDPREVVQPSEVPDDRRECGRDDRLVERGEEHAEHEGGEDHPNGRPGDGRSLLRPRSSRSRSGHALELCSRERRMRQRRCRVRPQAVEHEAEIATPELREPRTRSSRRRDRRSRTAWACPLP